MTETISRLGEKALQTWGSLALVALFGVLGGYGVFQYLLHKDTMEHRRFEARQLRESKLVGVIESTCGTVQNQGLAALARNRQLLERMDERGVSWTPVLSQLEDLLQRLPTAEEARRDHDDPKP